MTPAPIEQRTRNLIATLYPGLRPMAYRVLQDIYASTGRAMNVVQATRTWDDQMALYSQGRVQNLDGNWAVADLSKVVTNAKPGLSWHCFGLAFDCAWQGQDPYLKLVPKDLRDELWDAYGSAVTINGLRWGGKTIKLLNGVADLPHAEMVYGQTLADVNELYQHGGLRALWAHLDDLRGVPQGTDWGLPEEGVTV